MIFFNVIWAIKKYKLKILIHSNHFFFYTKDTVTNENTSLLTFQYTLHISNMIDEPKMNILIQKISGNYG